VKGGEVEMSEQVKGKKRRAYQKPQIECVKLVPEEAVLAGCKPGPGPQGASCNLLLGAICSEVTS